MLEQKIILRRTVDDKVRTKLFNLTYHEAVETLIKALVYVTLEYSSPLPFRNIKELKKELDRINERIDI